MEREEAEELASWLNANLSSLIDCDRKAVATTFTEKGITKWVVFIE